MGFGNTFVECMAIAKTLPREPHQKGGERSWSTVSVEPTKPLSIHPCAPVLNYGASVFEGMKSRFCEKKQCYLLFRPHENFKRLQSSCDKIALPRVDEATFFAAMKGVLMKARPVPIGGYVYLRPVVMCHDQEGLGNDVPANATFFVLAAYVDAPYFSGSLSLFARTDRVRAWPGGCGDKKFAGNYSGVADSLRDAKDSGYSQVLWLFPEHYDPNIINTDYVVTEAGVSNFFALVQEGEEIVCYTPRLDDGLILPGVTRSSVIQIVRDLGFECWEKRMLFHGDLLTWYKDGVLLTCFASGTAAGVTTIERVGYTRDGKEESINISHHELTSRIEKRLYEIQAGLEEGYQDWVVDATELSYDFTRASSVKPRDREIAS